MDIGAEFLFQDRYNLLHFAIAFIAIGLIATIVYELKKPVSDPNRDEDTKKMNDILKDD